MSLKWFPIACLFLLASCQKDTDDRSQSECFDATIVAAICGNVVFQINDKDFAHLGVDGWVNGEVVYDDVFFTTLNCKEMEFFGKLAAPTLVGMKLKVKINSEDEQGNCAVCLATLSNPPSKTLQIEVLKDNCQSLD